jgi:hypothetical protein
MLTALTVCARTVSFTSCAIALGEYVAAAINAAPPTTVLTATVGNVITYPEDMSNDVSKPLATKPKRFLLLST